MNIDMTHECLFLREKIADVKNRKILHCWLESVLIHFSPNQTVYPVFLSLKGNKQKNKQKTPQQTTKNPGRIYMM